MNDSLQGIQKPESNGMAVAALVIGICSMVLALIPVIGFLSWLLSPLAIILGAIALRKSTGRGMASGGIITGIIGVLICIAWVALFGAAMNAMPEGALEEFQREMERAAQEANQANQAGQAGGNSGDYQAAPTDGAAAAPSPAPAPAETGAGTSGGK